jgi:membrane protease YdiL (CAAX protease family)
VEDGFINMSDSELETIWRDRSNSKYSKAYIELVHQEILNRNLSLSSFQTSSGQSKWTRILGMGVVFWVLYMGCRAGVLFFYHAPNWERYFFQDLIITCFRFPLFVAILVLSRRTFSLPELGFRKGPLFFPMTVGVLIFSIVLIRLFSFQPFQAKPIYYFAELEINLLIAANEEISFRGFFYNCLLKIKNKNLAEYGSSILFTLMHVYYQPLTALPSIFIIGLTFAKLRTKGVSLTTLIAIHWVLDFIVFIYPPTRINPFPFWLYTLVLLLPLGVAFYWKCNETPDNLVKAS